MQLIIGLGNPGEKFKETRHNVGFRILDKIKELSANNTTVKLVKPQTFMNESGREVQEKKNFYKVDNENILVIHDDVDLPLGKIRIQLDGSSAGHKGIQSIIDAIGNDFWRVRVGVGKSDKIPTEAWVLQEFSEDEKKHLKLIVDKIADFMVESLGSAFSNELKEQTITVGAERR